MKKFVKTLVVLVLAAVAVGLTAGCGTLPVINESGRVIDKNDIVRIAGDIPKAGTIVNIRAVIGYETEGPYETAYVWRYSRGANDGGFKIFTITGGGDSFKTGIPYEGTGFYVVSKEPDSPLGIYFNATK